MTRKLPKKDVVIVGLGWTGSIMANELTEEGLDVVAIERGPWRDAATDFPPSYDQDELRYRIRHELFLRPDQTTFTFRNKMDADGAAHPQLGAPSCRPTGSAAAASTGMPRPGASCLPTSCCAPI
jgi:choline dehydrogenase-like flavoprotein